MSRVRMSLPDFFAGAVVVDGERRHLTPNETLLAALLLATPPDRFVNLETVIETLWPNPDLSPEWPNKCVDRHVSHLRAVGVPLETDFGFGWRIPEAARGGPLAPSRHWLDRQAA